MTMHRLLLPLLPCLLCLSPCLSLLGLCPRSLRPRFTLYPRSSFESKPAYLKSVTSAFSLMASAASTTSSSTSKDEIKREVDVNERRIIAQTVNWCAANSLLYSDGNMNFTHAPVSLAPNTFSASEFEYAQTLQPIINEVFFFKI